VPGATARTSKDGAILRCFQLALRENRDLLAVIHQGRGLTMPGYEGKLSNQQIEAVADFVQSQNGAAAP
jgi:mono/diheme cytochrome c family protein